MANDNDAKRDIKLTAALVGGVLVAVIGGGYFLWGWLASPAPEQSKIDVVRVAAAAHNSSPESQAYRDLLKQYNQEGASEARIQNSSFIASIPMEQTTVMQPAVAAEPVQQAVPTARRSHTRQADQSTEADKKNDPRQEALQRLLSRINPEVKTDSSPRGLSMGKVLGGEGGSGDALAGSVGGYDRWSETLPGGGRLQTASMKGGAEPYSPVEVVPPYWRGPGVIDIGVDSDNSTTPVLGKLGGAYAGAVLKAPEGARLAGDGVVIHFTEMAYKGVNYKVDAYALQDDTLLANVASEVDHRYMSRIVLPAVLAGIGNISDMYSNANTQVLTNGFSTQTVRPGMPDAAAVAGSILGGGASQAAKVLSEDASRTPATQVKVFQNQVVAIQFMRGVYAGDAIAPGRSGENVQSAIPAQAVSAPSPAPTQSQPLTPEQWRAQTQTRIQAQRRLQESHE
jgi:intracellular multiplication protein IcmE